MGLLGRRALPAALMTSYDVFRRCAEHVDLAQRAMIRCVPSSPRATPLPVEVGAETLRISLGEVRRQMPGWRHPDLEDVWQECHRALDQTERAIDAAAERAAATRELEVALTAVQELLDPLHAFVEAEARFAALRRRGRRRSDPAG